jgi:hypothetical protein
VNLVGGRPLAIALGQVVLHRNRRPHGAFDVAVARKNRIADRLDHRPAVLFDQRDQHVQTLLNHHQAGDIAVLVVKASGPHDVQKRHSHKFLAALELDI